MKKRIYILLLLLIILMPMRGQQYTNPTTTYDWQSAQPAQMYTTTMEFQSTAMQMGNYNVVFAAQDLSSTTTGVQRKPPVIGKDDEAPDTPGLLPVGDGIWALLTLSAFYALYVFVRRRKQARA